MDKAINAIEWELEYNQKVLVEKLNRAKKYAAQFSEVDMSDEMADWHLDSLAQNIQTMNEEVKECKGRIAALKIALEAVKKA